MAVQMNRAILITSLVLMFGCSSTDLETLQGRGDVLYEINSEKLSVLAKQKKSVCIAVDDLTKPTQAFRIIPFIF